MHATQAKQEAKQTHHNTIGTSALGLHDLLPTDAMPEIDVGSQIFDVVFHPTFATVYTGLLNGYIKAFAYNEQGKEQSAFSVRPSKRSCRGLSIKHDGTHLYSVGKAKALKYAPL
jgi:hypothetical protein